MPVSAIPALEAIPNLRLAQPFYALRNAGSVTSQGDKAARTEASRRVFGVSGAGITVGVLSDSFDCLGTAAAGSSSGDLPPSVLVIQEISDCANAVDEGRALLEVVHDVAPGASLAFASALNGQASFANNIGALAANGARVIVDDVTLLTEPMFQDGIVAQAIDSVVGLGVAYFSSAGNFARQSYESVFRGGATFAAGAIPSAAGASIFAGGIAHNFATSGPPAHLQRITITAGATLVISLQWDAPFFSVSGGLGSPSDVDIYLLDAGGNHVLGGIAANNVGGDASEVFSFTNGGPTADFNVMIVASSGPVPGFLKYVQFGEDITIAGFNTASGTVFGHANATGAEAMGAAHFVNTPEFGVSPPILEPFSSRGSSPILFDTVGNRLAAPIVRASSQRWWHRTG